jgi:ElaB/YqjD/DUF883 family membrane-anchored ribosome-binding protein
MSHSAKDIGKDMRDLRDEAAASGQRLADDARVELARLRAQVERLMEERVTPALGQAADTVEDYSRRARARVEENAHAVTDAVRERPLLSIGLAALAGYVIGRLSGTTTIYRDGR